MYVDLFPRKTKRSGAWMNPILENGLYKGKVRRPQVVFVCNLTPSTKDKPSLLTYSEVETIFHELGHILLKYDLQKPHELKGKLSLNNLNY